MTFISAISGGDMPTAPSTLGGLDSEAFLKLLVAQLRYQNPMAPSDQTAMLQQTAQFSQIEALQKLAQVQQQLLGLNHASMASGLIGKEVVAHPPDAETITGVVDSIRFTTDGPVLSIGGHEVAMSDAVEVRVSTDGP